MDAFGILSLIDGLRVFYAWLGRFDDNAPDIDPDWLW